MKTLTDQEYKDILKDPANFYRAPKEVINDERLSARQRDHILENWADDQKSLLVAESENMGEPVETENAATKLQEITDIKKDI